MDNQPDTTNAAPIPTKKDIRDAIFQHSSKRKSVLVTFFGQEFEIRQPLVGELDAMTADGKRALWINVLISMAYVPNTGEKIFDEKDIDVLRSLPFDGQTQTIMDAANKLTSMEIVEAEKN